jgi:hypothetical protein
MLIWAACGDDTQPGTVIADDGTAVSTGTNRTSAPSSPGSCPADTPMSCAQNGAPSYLGAGCCHQGASCLSSGACDCPADHAVSCPNQNLCCPQGSFCTENFATKGGPGLTCATCAAGETACGNVGDPAAGGGILAGGQCCKPGVQCTNSQCQCPADKPIRCFNFCCPSGTTCTGGGQCKPVSHCTNNNGGCTSDGDCCSHHCTSNLPGIPGTCF